MALWVERKGVWPWLVVVFAVAFSTALAWTTATNSLSWQAGRLDTVDLTLGSAAVTRAGASQAVIMATNHSSGTASAEAMVGALAELSANQAAFRELVERTGVPGITFGDATGELLLMLQQGAVAEARAFLDGELQLAYGVAVEVLSSERSAAVSAIDEAATLGAAMAGWLRIAAVIAVPVAAALLVHLMGRRRLRAERSQLLEMMHDLDGEAAKAGELLTDASHRMRTPLTSLYGLSEVLSQSKRVTGLERELATLVHAEASEMHRVADDYLALAQLRADTLHASAEIVALPEIVDAAAKPAKAAGVEIKVECPEVWVLSDPAKVKQIVRNLISNAVSHGAEPIFVEVSEVDGRVECVIIDHGPGLPTGVEPGSGRFGISGNGLEIAYRLTDSIGAKLTHRREAEQTRFCLAFTDEGPADVASSAQGAA